MSSWKYRFAAAPFRAADRLGFMPRPRTPIVYVVERANWSIAWDGTYVCRGVDRIAPGTIEVSSRPERLTNRIVHFGSQFQWLAWADAISQSNRFVVTFFHGNRTDNELTARHVDAFMKTVPRLEKIVTACRLVEDRLLTWGVPQEKLVRIPIAIDLKLFQPISPERRRRARAHYGFPDDSMVIGSFQKDGIGWGEGVEPKLIKGPDILVDVIARVAKQRQVVVLLTGPARGFVKRRLDGLGVSYVHDYVEDYLSLPNRYAALDVYINPSREEGGPKGILEAMASGVPVVSTAVGMAPEIIGADGAGRLVEVGDISALVDAVLNIDASPADCANMIAAAQKAVALCDWPLVGGRHYEEVYRPLIAG